MNSIHVIGDVHGNYQALCVLLELLGYRQMDTADPLLWVPPAGCRLVSVGDLVDRGPDSLACLRTVRRMIEAGNAEMVLGNHEWRMGRLLRCQLGLESSPGTLSPGRLMTWIQLLGLSREEKEDLLTFIESLPCFVELMDCEVVVVHARWERSFRRLERERLVKSCAFGRNDEGTQTEDVVERTVAASQQPLVDLNSEASLPERARWVRYWNGPATVFWGHHVVTPNAVTRLNDTINVESGCYQGHALSAFIYPEGRVVQASTTVHWKKLIRSYRDVDQFVFPRRLNEVQETAEINKLSCVDDYIAWLDLTLEDRSAPPLFPSLERAHRAMFDRCAEGD